MALAMTTEHDSNMTEVSKQAAKALKVVASSSKQVGEMLARKHERILKRIGSISEEIESLKGDVMENITHQRERRLQLTEIEEDVEQAQLLGNGAMVEELLEELRVLKDEAKREDSLYRALCKTVRSRKQSKKQFILERVGVEDEIRQFRCKQKLIQTLLATCAKQCESSDNTQGSSGSQSDCGASALEDLEDDVEDQRSRSDSSSSSGSFPENPLDSPLLLPSSAPQKKSPNKAANLLSKAVSLEPSPVRRALRVRSWSSDCVQPLPPREPTQTRTRHSLSVHFASPVLMGRKQFDSNNDSNVGQDIESLDLAGYMESIDEKPVDKTKMTIEELKTEETETEIVTVTTPAEDEQPQEPAAQVETKPASAPVKHLPVAVEAPEEEATTETPEPVETEIILAKTETATSTPVALTEASSVAVALPVAA